MASKAYIEKIVKKSQRGDENSFAEIFDIFYEKIFKYIKFRVDQNEVDDLVGEVFLKTVKNLKKYKPQERSTFGSWIYRIAHNVVIDFYRKKQEFLGIDIDSEDEEYSIQLVDDSPGPDKIMEQKIEFEKIQKVLNKLSATNREIIELKFMEDFSNFEIAQITGKSEGNIRIIQLRALRELRKYID